MSPWLSQAIDRKIIRMACAAQPPIGTYPGHSAEAAALMQQPDFFGTAAEPAARLEWISSNRFRFPSPVQTPCDELNVAYGKLQRVAGDWTSRPAVLLIHGWNDELGYLLRHPYQSHLLRKLGVNVAMLELPYHLQRRPRRPGVVRDFLCEDLHSSMLAVKQAMADIRALAAWLKAQGCPRIGIFGVSLGAWLSGLTICNCPHLSAAVLAVPVSRMDRVVGELDFCAVLRASLKDTTFDFERLNLRSHRPQCSIDNVLLLEAVDDLFANREAIEEFREAWGNPEIWRFQHAHISLLFSPFIIGRSTTWLARKLL